MKKVNFVISMIAVFILLFTGCGTSSKLPEGFTEEQVKEQTIQDIQLAYTEGYEAWKNRFQEEMQSGLTEASFDSFLSLLEEKGEFKEYGKYAFVGQEQDGNKYAACIMIVEYENGSLQYTVGYDEDMNLVQFVVK